ncbi:unnamed protein product [Caenorhabditis bovis]|uniref:Uncharacterized protein n=1 Tax=Caenorhabditis bovis TaxID=2654633 RepID=A0A8S1EN38_9PELO|nr:unnamed protein product [Caenorhabditis bovis]
MLGRVDNYAQSPASPMKAQGSETPFYPPKKVRNGRKFGLWHFLEVPKAAADMSVKDVVYDAVVKAMVSDAPKDDEFYRRLGKTVADVVKGEHREAHANECDHRLSAAMREQVEWAVAKLPAQARGLEADQSPMTWLDRRGRAEIQPVRPSCIVISHVSEIWELSQYQTANTTMTTQVKFLIQKLKTQVTRRVSAAVRTAGTAAAHLDNLENSLVGRTPNFYADLDYAQEGLGGLGPTG